MARLKSCPFKTPPDVSFASLSASSLALISDFRVRNGNKSAHEIVRCDRYNSDPEGICMAFVSAIAVTCQQLLIERDGVSSIIRMVEWFGIPPNTPLFADGKRPPIVLTLFISIRLTSDDEDPHSISFELERPNGDLKRQEVMPERILAPPNVPGGDRVINVSAQLAVEVIQFGKHVFHVLLDGVQVAMTAFFILESPPELSPSSSVN